MNSQNPETLNINYRQLEQDGRNLRSAYLWSLIQGIARNLSARIDRRTETKIGAPCGSASQPCLE